MQETFCDAIKFALEFEAKSHAFYEDASGKVNDKFAKKALEFLAAEEVEHVSKIESFNDALLNQRSVDLDNVCRDELPERLSELMDKVISDEASNITIDASDIDIYNIALDMEKQGYEAYTNAAENESEDDRVRTFFKFLADQEKTHYDMLAKSKKYLEDPSYYFEEYGGWIFG